MADVTTLGMAVDSSGVRRASDDLDKMVGAGKAAADATKEFERTMVMASAAGNVIGDAIGEVFKKTVELASAFISLGLGVGRYQDLAEKTASDDPVGLASLRTAADVAGTSVESAAQAINRMAIQLGKGDEDTNVGKALKSINLDINEFKKLSGVEQYKALAIALDKFGESQQKVQVIQAVTGRGGAEQLVMLKELASNQDEYNFLTKEQIQLADKLEDNTARSKSQLKQMAEVLAVQTLPMIDGLTEATKDAIKELFGMETQSGRLKAEAGVRDFAEGAAKALGFLVDAGDGVMRVFEGVAMTVGAAAAQLVSINNKDLKGAIEIGKQWMKDMDELAMRPLFSTRLEESMRRAREEANKPPTEQEKKPDIEFDGRRVKAVKEVRDEYGALINTLDKKQAAEQMEFDLGRKLTESEKERIDVYAQINKFKVLLTSDQMDAIDAHLLETEALAKLNAEHAKEVKLMKESADEAAKTIERAQQKADATEAQAKLEEELRATYGLSAEQVERLEVAKLRNASAELRIRTTMNDGTGAYEQLNALLNAQADSLDRVASSRENLSAKISFDKNDALSGAERAVKGYLERVKEAGTATEDSVGRGLGMLEDQLTNFASKGKGDIKGLIDYMIAEFMRLAVVRPLLNSILGAGGGSGGSGIIGAFLSLFSGGAGGGENYSNEGLNYSTPITRAGGGDVDPFSRAEVAERGPELATIGGKTYLMTGSKGGTVTSNDRMQGGNVTLVSSPNIRIDARSDQAQVMAIVQESIGQSNRQLMEQLKASGRI